MNEREFLFSRQLNHFRTLDVFFHWFILENTRHKSLKQTPFLSNFLEKSWHFYFTLFSSPKCAFSLPNVEPRVFWSTETTVIPKSTLGKGKQTQVFQDFWRVLYLVWRVTVSVQDEFFDHRWNIPAWFAHRWERAISDVGLLFSYIWK